MSDEHAAAAIAEWTRQSVQHENDGGADARAFFTAGLATSFRILRANGKWRRRAGFLADLKSGGQRSLVDGPHVEVIGRRAVVRCVIAVNGRFYDNVRVHLRLGSSTSWPVHLWANEEIPPPPV